MSGDTFEFDDKARVERLVGTLHDPAATTGDVLTVQADKSIAAQPGGGSGGVQAYYGSGAQAVNNGSTGLPLPFVNLNTGPELLDRTDNSNPTLLADGTYTLTVYCQVSALTAGGVAGITIGLPASAALAAGSTMKAALLMGATVTFVASAGDVLNVLASNLDGVSARNFTFGATLVKQ